MPFLSEAIREAAREPYFWSDFCFDEDCLLASYPEDEKEQDRLDALLDRVSPTRLTFPLPEGPTLTLDLNVTGSYAGLGIQAVGQEEPEDLGWDDMAHWHPHVLRWEEVELICRCLALTDPACAHPGLPLLLLARFAPITKDDDAAMIFGNLEAAWRSLGIPPGPFVQWFRYAGDMRNEGCLWQEDIAQGWHITAPGSDRLYTLRTFENDTFPRRTWSAFLDGLWAMYSQAIRPEWREAQEAQDGAVRRLAEEIAESGDLTNRVALQEALREAGCENATILGAFAPDAVPAYTGWVLEALLDREFGTIVRRLAPPMSRVEPDTVYEFSIEIPIPQRHSLTMVATDQGEDNLWSYLNSLLHEAGIGKASCGPATSTASGHFTSESISVYLVNDREAGLAIIRDALQKADVPPDTQIIPQGASRQDLPLPSADPVREIPPLSLPVNYDPAQQDLPPAPPRVPQSPPCPSPLSVMMQPLLRYRRNSRA